jgi:hypothetical protein
MDLKIAEKYQIVKQAVAAHWKTGVAITTVAAAVHHLYGKAAMVGIVLLTVSSYQVIGQHIRVITWRRLRITLMAVVIFSSNYYAVIHPRILCNVAVSLLLIDSYQLVSINADLSTQNITLQENNSKLLSASAQLKNLEQELQKLKEPAARLQTAQEDHQQKTETLHQVIPEEVKAIPCQLDRVAALFKELFADTATQELMKYQGELRTKISSMLNALDGVYQVLEPLTQKVEGLSGSLTDTTAELQTNVMLTSRQIQAVKEVLENLRRIK